MHATSAEMYKPLLCRRDSKVCIKSLKQALYNAIVSCSAGSRTCRGYRLSPALVHFHTLAVSQDS